MSPTGRARTLLVVVGTALGALVIIVVGMLWVDRATVGDDLNDVMAVNERQEEVIDELVENVEENRQQLLDEGITPSAPPPEDVVEDLPEIERPGEPFTLSDEQLQNAVTVVLTENPNFITPQVIAEVTRYLVANPPEPGEPGADADAAMAFEAIVSFCSGPDEPCKGDQGDPGEDAVITQTMVTTALADICATDPGICQSIVPGPIGEPGRSVIGLACNDDGVLVATFDKPPLTQVVEGSVCQFPPGQGGKKS